MSILLLSLIFFLTITTLTCIYFLRYCWILAKYINKDFNLRPDPSYQPPLSIIIPTYNEAVVIEDKIRNTLKLNYPDEIEIIVIDSASTDGTPDIVERFEKVKVIRQTERRGKSSALAEVFKLVSGEVVIITDADALLDENVLINALPYLADKSVGAVTGKQILINPNETISQKSEQSYRDFFDIIRTAESKLESTMIFNGPFMAFKKQVLEAPPQNSVADDTEMAFQVIKKGYRTLYVPEALFYENIPLSDRSRIKQKERRAQGLVQSFWRHRYLLFNKKYGKFASIIFPAEFAVHIILPFMIFLSLIMVAVSLFIDFTFTLIVVGAFCVFNAIYAIPVYSTIGKSFNNSSKTNGSYINLIITIKSFIQLQFALLKGALKLIMFGTSHKWEQISDARIKIKTEDF